MRQVADLEKDLQMQTHTHTHTHTQKHTHTHAPSAALEKIFCITFIEKSAT